MNLKLLFCEFAKGVLQTASSESNFSSQCTAKKSCFRSGCGVSFSGKLKETEEKQNYFEMLNTKVAKPKTISRVPEEVSEQCLR
jgi:hypothetical protein